MDVTDATAAGIFASLTGALGFAFGVGRAAQRVKNLEADVKDLKDELRDLNHKFERLLFEKHNGHWQ